MEAAFHIGQVIEHLKVGYRGVVYEVDAVFSLDDEWYEQVARSRPPKDKPWYHVLVHGADHTTYVAERHLQAATECSQIEHPMLGRYFNRFDGTRYYPKALN